jgi:hypothetical protein
MILGELTLEPKISQDNAIKVLKKMMERYQVARLQEEHVNLFIDKIMMGGMSLEKDGIAYELFHSVKIGGDPRKTFTLQFPDSKSLKDNEIKIEDFQSVETGQPLPGVIEKLACILLGIPSEHSEVIPIKDKTLLFHIGCRFFLAN